MIKFKGLSFIFSLFVMLVLGGCKTTPNQHVSEYDKTNKASLPEISFFIGQPSKQLAKKCQQFDEDSVLDHCRINHIDWLYYLNSLRQSEMFQKVLLADKEADYQLEITTALLNQETAGDLSKAALAGATLLVVPVTSEKIIDTEVNLYWHGELIKQFNYQLPLSSTMSLFHNPEQGYKDFAETVISRFIKDAQEQEVFTPWYLAKVLQSSDYINDFKSPEVINDYVLTNDFIYNDPFLGARLRYMLPDYASDYIDVFVYPIRKIDWQNQKEMILPELNFMRSSLEELTEEESISRVELQAVKPLDWQQDQTNYKGYYFDGVIEHPEEENSYLSTYLFVKNDKFIRINATFPSKFSLDFVKQAISQIETPPASVFMKKLREKYQQKQLAKQAESTVSGSE